MSRMRVGAALLLLMVGTLWLLAPGRPALATGAVPAPWTDGVWVHGDPVTLEALAGEVVVLEFWATWCGPCLAQMPKLADLHERYHAEGLRIVAVTDEPAGKAVQVKLRFDLPFGILAESRLAGAYGVRQIPYAVVIGRDGLIAWQGNPGGGLEGAVRAALSRPRG